jgi:phosphate-selective porin OprO/OprP
MKPTNEMDIMEKGHGRGRAAIFFTAFGMVFAAAPMGAQADGMNTGQLRTALDRLQQQIDALQAQQTYLEAQQNVLNAQAAEQAKRAQRQAEVAMQQAAISRQQLQAANHDTWYATGDGPIPLFQSSDGKSSFKIGGNIEVDAALGTVPRQSGLSGGTELRRIELYISGVYAGHYVYKVEEDFSKTSSPLGGVEDAYLGYQTRIGSVGNVFLAGNQHTPFGFQIPSEDTLFLEPELGNGLFQDGRQLGITGQSFTRHWNAWYGVTAAPAVKTTTVFTGNSQSTISGVLAWNLVNSPGYLLSIRNSVAFNKFNAEKTAANAPIFATTPDLNVYGTSLISTGALGVQSDFVESPRIDIEYRRLTVSGVYYTVSTQSNGPISNKNPARFTPGFSSYDVEAAYFLTDDFEPYGTAQGYYLGVKPSDPVTQGGPGAIQIAARLDEANLNSAKFGVHGGNETNLTLGVNWWPTEATRVNLNYIKVFPIKNAASATNRHASASIFGARLEFIY